MAESTCWLLIISRYMEVHTFTTTTSVSIIHALKAILARHGIPSVLVSDNGPQYSSTEMQEFAEWYNFQHITSSPHYPQSNSMAERAVKTAKSLLEKSVDPHMALLSYRATPLPWCGLSPAEPLMGRRLQTDIPQPKRVFIPDWPYLASFREKDEKQKGSRKDSRKQSMTGVTEPDHCHHSPVMRRFGCELKTDRFPGESSDQQPHRGPTSWRFHLESFAGTRATFHQDQVKHSRRQFQLNHSSIPSPHGHGQELALVLPPDSRTGKGEMWHTGSHYKHC